MTSVRSKRGRRDVELTTSTETRRHRRGAVPAPPVRLSPSTDASGLAFAYALALGDVAHALDREAASPSPKATADRERAQGRARDIKHRLSLKIGRAEVEHLRDELTRDGALALRAAVAAEPATSAYVIRAKIDAGRIAREHGLDTTAAWSALSRSARWSAEAASSLDRAFAEKDPKVRAELLKIAAVAGREARLDLLAAIHVSRERRVHEVPAIDVAGAVARFEAEQRARAVAEGTSGDPDDADPDAGDGEAPLAGDDDEDDREDAGR